MDGFIFCLCFAPDVTSFVYHLLLNKLYLEDINRIHFQIEKYCVMLLHLVPFF